MTVTPAIGHPLRSDTSGVFADGSATVRIG